MLAAVEAMANTDAIREARCNHTNLATETPAGSQLHSVHRVFSNSSRPISMRLISLVPAPIS